MSEALERKIVELQFDNAEFERRVAKSMKTIESLKKELDFDESAKSLNRLEKAANDISFKGLEKETTSLGDLFDWSSIFKISLLQKVADQVIGTATRMLKSLTIDNVSAGMTKYEMKTKSVQTIMAATGKSVAEVEKVLERLNHYTDMTSYDFADMTNNIGKFTSAGIDLETAEVAMEGIANWAAVSGQEIAGASRAMYNLSQALSVGHVKLIDWKSIENANMATKEFKEYVIDTAIAMGKLKQVGDKVGKTMKGTAVDYKNFSQTLSEGWFDNDVLIATLTQYADTNTAIGAKAYEAAKTALTFTQAMQAVRDSISTGWMKTWQLLFGDVEEAGIFFTGLCDSIIEVTERIDEARNNLLQEWRDFTSIFTDENGNNYKGKDMASLIFHTVWDTIVSVGAAITRAMEMVANPSSVLFGNGGFDMHGWTVAVENIEDLATGNMLGKITDGILGFVGAIREFIYGESIFGGQRIVKLVHIFTGLFSILDIGRQIIGSILGFVGRIAKYLTPLVDAALEIGAALGDVFYMIDLSLRSGGLKALGDSLFEFLRPALDWLNSVGTKIKDWVLKQIEKIPDLLEKITKKITKFLDSLRKWGKRVTNVFKPILRPLEYIWNVVKGWFSGEGLENMNLWDKIQEIWKRITNTDFSKWKISFQLAFADIKNRASNLWNVIKDTVKQKWGIDLSWVDEAIGTVKQKWSKFTGWWQSTAIYKWFTEADQETKLTGFQTVAYAIGDAFKGAWDFFTEPDTNGETGFQRWKQNLLDRCNEIKVAIEKWQGWTDIGKFFSSIWDWFTKAQWQGEQRDEHGNLAGFEFFGTGVQYAVFKVKNWFEQAAKDIEKWWNSDNPFAVVFRTIANGVWAGLTNIWNFFTDDNTDTGKTQFQNWVDELYRHYEEIKTKITTWKGWDDISNFFGGIWDYFTKAQWQGEQRDEHGNLAGFDFFGTRFEYTIYQVKQWFDKVGGEIDAWWNGNNIIRTAFETIKGWFAGIVTWFKEEALPRNGVGEGPSFEAFFVNVGDDIKAAWEKITAPGTFLGGLKNTVGDLFSSVWDWFTKRKVHGLKVDEEGNLAGWEFVGTGVGYAVYKITEWFNNVADEITVWWNGDNLLRKAIEFVWSGVGELLKWVEDESKPRTEEEAEDHPIILFFRNLGRDIEQAWTDIAGEGTFLHDLAETVKGFFKPIWDALFGVGIEGKGPSKEVIEEAWRKYQEQFTLASAGLSDAGGGMGSGMKKPMGKKEFEEWYTSEGYKTDETYLKDLAENQGISGFLKRVQTKLNEFWTWAKPWLEPVKKFFEDLWKTIHEFFTKEIEEYDGKTGWQHAIDEFVKWLDGLWQTITSWGGWEQVVAFFREIGSAISDFFTTIFGGGTKQQDTTKISDKGPIDPKHLKEYFETANKLNKVTMPDEKKTLSIFDTLSSLFGKIGEILKASGIEEFQNAPSLLEKVPDAFHAVWDTMIGIVTWIADKRPGMMLLKYGAFRIGIQIVNGAINGLATVLGSLVSFGLGKLAGKIPGYWDFVEASNSLPKLMLSIAAVVGAVALLADVTTHMDTGDWAELASILAIVFGGIILVLSVYNKKNKGLMSTVNTALSTAKKSKAEVVGDAISKVVDTLMNNITLIILVNQVAEKADQINKFRAGGLAEYGRAILDIGLALAAITVAMSVALRITKGMSVSEMLMGAIGIGGAITIFTSLIATIGSLIGTVDAASSNLEHGDEFTVAKQISHVTDLFTEIGKALGSFVGSIVDSYKEAVFKGDERRKEEALLNAAENAMSFARELTGLSEQANPEDMAAFERLVEYFERLSAAAVKLAGNPFGIGVVGDIGRQFKSYAQSVSDIFTILNSRSGSQHYGTEQVTKTLSAMRDLISVTDMMLGVVENFGTKAEKLSMTVDENGRIIGKDGKDFTAMAAGIYEAISAMLMYQEVDDNMLPGEPMIYQLGEAMGKYYNGMASTLQNEELIDATVVSLHGAFASRQNEFENIGKIIPVAISEGILENKDIVIGSAAFLGTTALAAYNKNAEGTAEAQAKELIKTFNQFGKDLGISTEGITDILSNPLGFIAKQGLSSLTGGSGGGLNIIGIIGNVLGIEGLTAENAGTKLSEMANSVLGDMFSSLLSEDGPIAAITKEGGYIDQIKGMIMGGNESPLVQEIGESLFGEGTDTSKGLVTVFGEEVSKYFVGKDGLLDQVKNSITGEHGIVKTFVGEVNDETPTIIGKIGELGGSLLSTFTGEQGVVPMVQASLTGENGLVTVFTNELETLPGAVELTMTGITTAVNNNYKPMVDAGTNLIAGVCEGITKSTDDATSAAELVAKLVLEKFNTVWEVGSPSKAMEEIGEFLIEGLEIGIDGEGNVFLRIIEKLGETIADVIKTALIDAFNLSTMKEPVMPVPEIRGAAIKDEADNVGDIFAEEFSSRVGAAMVPEMDTGGAFNSLVKTWDDVSKVYGKETPDWADVPMSTILDRAKEKVEEAMNPDDAKDTGRKYSETLTNTIKGIFDLADSDLTYEPVIRPIIDWSNVTANVGYGGRILSGMPGLTGGTYAAGTLEETMKIQNGKNNGDLYNVVVDIRDKVDQLDRDVMNMKIVLNTGVLAGELVNDIDNELGQRVLNNGRAN